MITLPENTEPSVTEPASDFYRNRPVVRRELIKRELTRQFRFIYGIAFGANVATTPDGMDAVLWDSFMDHRLRLPSFIEREGYKLTCAVVHSNSRRQRSALYGGIVKDGAGVLVFDKYPLRFKEQTMPEVLERAVSRWGVFIDQYGRYHRELREMELTGQQYARLLVNVARAGFLSWSRLGKFDHERDDRETGLSFLLRLSRHVARQPPISHEPARSQPWSLFGAYRTVIEMRS